MSISRKDMINIDSLNKDEKIFLNEFEIYNNAINAKQQFDISKNLETITLSHDSVLDNYYHLLKQAVKLVKISDSSQLKLRNAQIKLKEQNDRIELQNVDLLHANQEKDKLLGIINKELSNAAEYVKSLLPKPIEDSENIVKIDYIYEPSSKLGGDMFGYKMYDEDNLIIFLLDVCGHGVGPALYSVSVFNALNNRSLLNVDFLSPSSVFTGLNNVFNMGAHNDMYFTMWYGVLNLKTMQLKYSNAGHPHPILITDDKLTTFPECDNFFIGGIPNWKYAERTYTLKRGDSFFLFSDGVFEIRKNENEYYDIKLLEEYLSSNFNDPKLCCNVFQYMKDMNYDKTLDDDFSFLKVEL